jgi:hypothetical protein
MTALARTSGTSKRQTHPHVREGVTLRTMTASVHLENKIAGRESQGACRPDELIGGEPPVVM